MEARKLKTYDDLAAVPEERVELIDGEIVQRPMARSEHGLVQSRACVELGPCDRRFSPGGWWIITEVSIRYELHQCPCHDIAGWRKRRMPERPQGIMRLLPDWVCEIVSPGHERKDTLHCSCYCNDTGPLSIGSSGPRTGSWSPIGSWATATRSSRRLPSRPTRVSRCSRMSSWTWPFC